jgi:hypothetical protein
MLAASLASAGLALPGGLGTSMPQLPMGIPAPLPMAPMQALGGMGVPGGAMTQRAGDMRSMQAVAGVTRLMQQCSSMLRERMFMGGGTPQQLARSPAPFDPQEVGGACGWLGSRQAAGRMPQHLKRDKAARSCQALAPAHPPASCRPLPQVLFPVVDSVLGQITQEYEKRLLQKDHDLTSARERAAAAQREALELAVGWA